MKMGRKRRYFNHFAQQDRKQETMRRHYKVCGGEHVSNRYQLISIYFLKFLIFDDKKRPINHVFS